MTLRIGLLVVAALLLGAHFYRAGSYLATVPCAVAPLLFCVRRRWSLVLLQLFAYAAATTWVIAALRLVQERRQLGRPWTAAVVILGTVALFTLVAGLLLNSRAIAGRYPAGRAADATPPRP